MQKNSGIKSRHNDPHLFTRLLFKSRIKNSLKEDKFSCIKSISECNMQHISTYGLLKTTIKQLKRVKVGTSFGRSQIHGYLKYFYLFTWRFLNIQGLLSDCKSGMFHQNPQALRKTKNIQYPLWCPIKMRVFHQNESCLSCLRPLSSYEGRREQGRQLLFL